MQISNAIYTGANQRKSLIDLESPSSSTSTCVIFIHGYKGYKDWGCWSLVQSEFIKAGIAFCKFNISHNGGTIEEPIDFPDLEAFGKNRYTYELEDVSAVIEYLDRQFKQPMQYVLLGHSRGGGIALLSGVNKSIKSVITWAGIDDIPSRFPSGDELQKWKEKGVYYVVNGRTKQEMPHYFSFYEDWEQNKERLNIENHTTKLKEDNVPCLHIHGENDEAVSIQAAQNIANWTGGELTILEETGHTFDSKHPWTENQLPDKLARVVERSIDFVKSH